MEEDIEKVKEMKYLGFIMEKNGGSEKHILEILIFPVFRNLS